MEDAQFLKVITLVPIFLFSLCVHEWAHAKVAFALGDDTAQKMGRLTFNPLAHADLFGTFIIPTVCIYLGWPFLGWAKPVPVDMRVFKNPLRGMAIVAAAGPVSNFLLALAGTLCLTFFMKWGDSGSSLGTEFLPYFVLINLFLAFFNLLPIPPLDGSRILGGLLPVPLALQFFKYERFASFLLVVLFFTGLLGEVAKPVYFVFQKLLYFGQVLAHLI